MIGPDHSPAMRSSILRNNNSANRLSGKKAGAKMILQASSPDEIALVKYSNSIKMELVERDRTFVQLQNCQGIYENYEIIANFPFSSQSKKMSVLVRQKETNKIIYYVKGAEVVMEGLMKANQRALLLEFCEQLAMEGLRTLVFAQKVLTEGELENFMEMYNAA
jgi:phospholipid-translocating ATPase